MQKQTRILVSNIGNRNISYKGVTYPSFSKDTKEILGSFRDWSQKLLKNFEEEKQHIELNILDTLIDEKQEEIDKIYLFYSDHPAGERNDQDTLFEAEIMKILIEEQYQIPTELKKVKAVVVDNNTLLRFYRNALRSINKFNKQPYIIVCDAGGTAQQKSALKIILEFSLPANRYEVQYVNFGKLEQIEPIEYRNIISTEQAASLIEDGQYYSAIKVLGFDSPELATNQKDKNFKLLAHLFFRFHANEVYALSNIQSKIALESPLLDAYLKKQAFSKNEELKKVFGEAAFLKITERFYKVIFYFKRQKWSSTLLALSQFYEDFFEYAYRHLKDQMDIENKFKIQYTSFITDFNKDKAPKDHYRINGFSVPVRCMICKLSEVTSISTVGKLISPHLTYTDDSVATPNVYTLNGIRNKIAHEGKIITNSDKALHLPYLDKLIEQLKEILILEKEDLFGELNDFVIERLRST